MLKTVLVFFAKISLIFAYQKCCDGDVNELTERKCVNGTFVGVTCPQKFVLNSNDPMENFTITEEGLLISTFDEFWTPVSEDRFCISKIQGQKSDVAIICADDEEDTQLWTLRAICVIVSVFFLLLTIIVYLVVKSLRDYQGKCVLSVITGVAVAFMALALLQFNPNLPHPLCETVAFVLYYSFMIAFFWLNVLSFHIWKTSVYPGILGTEKQWQVFYYFYAYGIPTLLLIIALSSDLIAGDHIKPNIGKQKCWFGDTQSIWVYFYGPISVILLINIFLFVWTVKVLYKDMEINSTPNKIISLRYKCLLYLKLFFIMGLTWIFEVLSFAFEKQNKFVDFIWDIFDYVNMLQGVLIFLVLVVFRKRALKGLAKRGLCCIKFPSYWTTLHHDEECDEIVSNEILPTTTTHRY